MQEHEANFHFIPFLREILLNLSIIIKAVTDKKTFVIRYPGFLHFRKLIVQQSKKNKPSISMRQLQQFAQQQVDQSKSRMMDLRFKEIMTVKDEGLFSKELDVRENGFSF